MAVSFTIGGVTKTLQQGWSIEKSINGIHTFNGVVRTVLGTYRPALDASVVVVDGSTTIFGGVITGVREYSPGGAKSTQSEVAFTANDYRSLASRRYVTETIAAGTLKAALQVLDDYLTPYGVTLDAAQVTGPSLGELAYEDRKLAEVLDELSTISGYVWEIDYTKTLRMYAPGTLIAPYNITSTGGILDGDVSVEQQRVSGGDTGYANRVIVRGGTPEVPVTAQADDAGEQATHGIWEDVIAAPTATDTATAQVLADAYLLTRLETPKTVTYPTFRRDEILPGQTQTINISERNINNTFLVTDVTVTNDPESSRIRRKVTAIEGTTLKGDWRGLYRQWTSGLPNQFSVATAVGAGRQVYPLQMAADLWVRDATPTWVSASGPNGGVQVTIDTVSRGSVEALVYVRMRVRSGTVQARLYNLSDSVSVGSSISVSSTSFTNVSFAVTLTAGAKLYELQLLPGSANVDVQAIGYLE